MAQLDEVKLEVSVRVVGSDEPTLTAGRCKAGCGRVTVLVGGECVWCVEDKRRLRATFHAPELD